MTPRLPTIRTARHLAKAGELDGVIIVGLARGNLSVVSYGKTKRQCRELAAVTDYIADALGEGVVPLPSFRPPIPDESGFGSGAG